MLNKLTPAQRLHMARIKAMDCIVCGAPGPSEAHHVRQHRQYVVLPLCTDCHTGSHNGIHGRRAIWNVRKLDELDALNLLVEKLVSAQ